eukprot:COSAG05_NODE_1011_length_6206_cov_2.116751_8_plen_190_part_00
MDKPTRFVVVPVANRAHIDSRGQHAVCAGTMVQIFQRQSQAYLQLRGNKPVLFRPFAKRSDYEAVPVTTVRADLQWKLQALSMQWAGRTVAHGPANEGGNVYTLRDAISNQYLREVKRELSFADTDTQPECHWNLVPFAADTTSFIVERTQFYLQNAVSGNRLGQNESTKERISASVLGLRAEASDMSM